MKKICYLMAIVALVACKNASEKQEDESTPIINEETTEKVDFSAVHWDTYNNEFPDQEDGGNLLLGKVDFEGLQSAPYNEWFELNKKAHVLDTLAIDSIQPLLEGINIVVFMGTWCEDSQREIPALHTILTQADYDINSIEMFSVSHDKDTPSNMEKGYDIEYVPSILLMKNGKELNRIVEYPQNSLEQDILDILLERPYKHAYAE